MDHYIEVTFYILVFILVSFLTAPAGVYAGEVEVDAQLNEAKSHSTWGEAFITTYQQ